MSYLVGVQDGCLPEHRLQSPHTAHNMLDLCNMDVSHGCILSAEYTYLDVTKDGLPMLGFLESQSTTRTGHKDVADSRAA